MAAAAEEGERDLTAASVLSRQPPIFYVRPRPMPFGLAGRLAGRRPDLPMTCLVRTMWSLEASHHLHELVVLYRQFRARHAHIRLIVAANTPRELKALQRRGVEAVLANHNIFVDERIFKPLPEVEPVYDAIYNAAFSPFKRRELAAEIGSCAHIGYVADPDRKHDTLAALEAAKAALPHHDFLNPVVDGHCRRLGPREVNRVLATARVGLCLSEAEGAMTASVEYLLAGLPVVTTPSIGGRHRYFTDQTAIVVEPDPRAVREAVEALKARALPRGVVRRRTLRLMEPDRAAFNAFIDRLREGYPPIAEDPRWHFHYVNNLYEWRRVGDFAAALGLGGEAA